MSAPYHYPLMKKAYDLTMAQGERSADLDEQLCLYEGPDGLKCAVGQILPPHPSGGRWDALDLESVLHLAGIPGPVSDWYNLQHCHDRASDEDFRSTFRERVRCWLPEFWEWMEEQA